MSADSFGDVVRRLRRSERPPAANAEEQLKYLERDVQEVRTRVNALFFTVLAAALGDVVGRLAG